MPGLLLALAFVAGALQAQEVVSEPKTEGDQEAAEPMPESVVDDLEAASHDGLRDPLIAHVIRRVRLVHTPRFSLEIGGKLQVQYYDADPDDEDNEDDLSLRRFRPFLLGHFLDHWTWKLEIEQSASNGTLELSVSELNIRDAFVRYHGFRLDGRQLTIGNQKLPFAHDFMTPSTSQFFPERSFAGDFNAGVPNRGLGVKFRSPTPSDKLLLWGSLVRAVHHQDVTRLRWDSPIGASSDRNEGLMAVGRVDLRPLGPPVSQASPRERPRTFTFGLAGYAWSNDGDNAFTRDGVALDPERADLEEAWGWELSAAVRGRGLRAEAQMNRIHGETVVGDFTGGIYSDGETDITSGVFQAGYFVIDSRLEITAGYTSIEAEAERSGSDHWIAGLNFHLIDKYQAKLQIAHRWISNDESVAENDFREARIQLQYVW